MDNLGCFLEYFGGLCATGMGVMIFHAILHVSKHGVEGLDRVMTDLSRFQSTNHRCAKEHC